MLPRYGSGTMMRKVAICEWRTDVAHGAAASRQSALMTGSTRKL